MQLDQATQGLQLAVLRSGRFCEDFHYGKTYAFYDIASLTKIVFTTSAFIAAEETGLFSKQQLLKDYLPHIQEPDLQVGQLLNHSAGHVWWRSFYQELLEGVDIHGLHWRQQWQRMRELLSKEQRQLPATQYIYSDVDFLFLAPVLEQLYGKDLLEIWQGLAQRLGVQEEIFFHPDNMRRLGVEQYAPTEISPITQQALQGQVHDENCFALGGVSTHAGLFASLQGMKIYLKELRASYLGESNWVRAAIFRSYSERSCPATHGDWGYGFMKPTAGKASCGKYFSDASFGHTGFTGTSLWFDPQQDLGVVMLSNRVYPSRENRAFVALRAKIHDVIVEFLTGRE